MINHIKIKNKSEFITIANELTLGIIRLNSKIKDTEIKRWIVGGFSDSKSKGYRKPQFIIIVTELKGS